MTRQTEQCVGRGQHVQLARVESRAARQIVDAGKNPIGSGDFDATSGVLIQALHQTQAQTNGGAGEIFI